MVGRENPMAKLDPTVELLLAEAQRNRFYGEITLKFEAGRVVIVRRNETIKPSGGRENRGDEV